MNKQENYKEKSIDIPLSIPILPQIKIDPLELLITDGQTIKPNVTIDNKTKISAKIHVPT